MKPQITEPEMDYRLLATTLAKATTDQELFSAIVNAPFEQKVATASMFLGIMVLLIVNKETGTIDRIALSRTELAQNTLEVSVVPFERIKIPIGVRGNVVASAIENGQPDDTTDWHFLFHPALSSQDARINQASAGIAYSAVYPFKARDGGALIYSYFQHEESIDGSHKHFMEKYTEIVNRALS